MEHFYKGNNSNAAANRYRNAALTPNDLQSIQCEWDNLITDAELYFLTITPSPYFPPYSFALGSGSSKIKTFR